MTVGSCAEVWWDDAWYRCSLHSVSADGARGVLEFLPGKTPRKRRRSGREFSMELDIDEWVRVGHLVRPKTHLAWD